MRDLRPGINADYDMDQYSFPRTSGLPRDYFETRWDCDLIVFCVITVLGVLALALFA